MNQTDSRTLVSFDWAMKNILREKANFDVLEGFLSTLLGEDIRILSLLESEGNQQHDLDKYNRVDLLAIDANETILVIEIQYSWQPAYLKRVLYGTSKLIVENMKLGEPFDKVRKVISISILYFPFSHEDDEVQDYLYHSRTEFYGLNSGQQLLLDMAKLPKPENGLRPSASVSREIRRTVNIFPEYYLIEVEHFQNIIRQPIDEWIYLFKNSEVRDEFHSRNIQAAREKLTLLQMNEMERRAYENFLTSRANALEMLEAQFATGKEQGIEIGKEQGIEIGKEQGIEIGKEQGKEEVRRENARKMRAKGIAPALIAEITGLTEAEIVAL